MFQKHSPLLSVSLDTYFEFESRIECEIEIDSDSFPTFGPNADLAVLRGVSSFRVQFGTVERVINTLVSTCDAHLLVASRDFIFQSLALDVKSTLADSDSSSTFGSNADLAVFLRTSECFLISSIIWCPGRDMWRTSSYCLTRLHLSRSFRSFGEQDERKSPSEWKLLSLCLLEWWPHHKMPFLFLPAFINKISAPRRTRPFPTG